MIIRHDGQYTLRAILVNGERRNKRTGIPCKAASWMEEKDPIPRALKQAELAFVQALILDPPDPRCRYKTVSDAVTAYLEWFQTSHRASYTQVKSAIKPFIAEFGDMKPNQITKTRVIAWLDRLSTERTSWLDFKHVAERGGAVINWLIERDQWAGTNPFSRQVKKYQSRFPARLPVRGFISDAEHEALALHADPTTKMFIEISRCTGLRESEVYALKLQHLNRVDRTWMIHYEKPTEGYRRIAVPDRLIAALADVHVLDWTNARVLWENSRKAAQCNHIQRKMFRKDFSTRMRAAGASHSHIVFQQGRTGDVTTEYYFDEEITLREVGMFINRMFGDSTLGLI